MKTQQSLYLSRQTHLKDSGGGSSIPDSTILGSRNRNCSCQTQRPLLQINTIQFQLTPLHSVWGTSTLPTAICGSKHFHESQGGFTSCMSPEDWIWSIYNHGDSISPSIHSFFHKFFSLLVPLKQIEFIHTCPFQDTIVFLKTHWPFSRPLTV